MARLSHGWRLEAAEGISPALIRDFLRPAVRAVPSAMARQLGFCRFALVHEIGRPRVASQWTAIAEGFEISVAAAAREPHDVGVEVLLCLGQALWTTLSGDQRKAYWLLLDAEIRAGVPGEIDEEALSEKKALIRGRESAASRRRLERYGAASFAGTAAEYVHSLWHDVTVRSGPEFLPPAALRRRLKLLSRWYPPDRGHELFPRSGERPSGL